MRCFYFGLLRASKEIMSIFSLISGRAGRSGFGSASTAEQVTEGIDDSKLTAIVTGQLCFSFHILLNYLLFPFFFLISFGLFVFMLFYKWFDL